ncbi:hypothetical protein [Photobacterium salinisoli]|uniref:hypothetical protein n=1 Tax=Photobacterium salinisoli TaxID=1616783 RepID=UPI000EA3AAD1|nr:hypothetical protein [Photobacterium salinisoli]
MRKSDFIRNNIEIINKEYESTLNILVEKLESHGYVNEPLSYPNTPTGVILEVSERIKDTLTQNGWVVECSFGGGMNNKLHFIIA